MTRNDRVRYEMFSRVRQFGNTHGKHFGKTSIGGQAFATVSAAVAELEQYAKARVRTSGAGKVARARARQALADQLTDVARTARLVSTKVSGDGPGAFKVPQWRSTAGRLTAARAVIDDGRSAAEVLTQLGLRETFVDELQALVDRFEEADRGRQAGRLGLAAAKAGFAHAMAQAADAVHTLDVIVANTFKKNPTVLAEWEAARHSTPKRVAASKATEAPGPAPTAAGSAPPPDEVTRDTGGTDAPAPDPSPAAAPDDPALRRAS